MPEKLLTVQLSEHAEIAYTSLGPEDRRRVDAWFDHLRNWRNDEFIRSRSKQLKSDDVYVFQTSGDIVIAFRIIGEKVVIVSILRKEALRAFEALAERSGP